VDLDSRLSVALWPQGATVLIVDDDPSVRAVARLTLLARGFQVREASDGASALRILQQHPREIWLVLTDLMMTGMSGRELAARVLAAPTRPQVLLMSGSSRVELDGLAPFGVQLPYLRKPFAPEELVSRVQELLVRVSPTRTWTRRLSH
jgi:two-component system, cell cycle sensor histidine kinase and response regulator CckA